MLPSSPEISLAMQIWASEPAAVQKESSSQTGECVMKRTRTLSSTKNGHNSIYLYLLDPQSPESLNQPARAFAHQPLLPLRRFTLAQVGVAGSYFENQSSPCLLSLCCPALGQVVAVFGLEHATFRPREPRVDLQAFEELLIDPVSIRKT